LVRLFRWLCVWLALISHAWSWAAEPVAEVAYLRGGGSAQLPGAPARALRPELPLYVNDRVSTAADSAVRIVFADKTDAWVGAEAVMVIDGYRHGKEESTFAASVLRGTFRFLTGLIGRAQPRAVRINISPASTIGIRGTHFAGEVRENSAVVVLLEPESGAERSAIEVSNQFGSVVIDEAGFGTEIPDEFSPPSAPRRMQLRAVENLLRSIQSIQRIQVPRLPR
jgi:hypothetical protein